MGANIPPIVVDASGGCRECGNPDINVPDVFDDETKIHCGKCGHTARHAEFFAGPEV
jgi:hypothetical protein